MPPELPLHEQSEPKDGPLSPVLSTSGNEDEMFSGKGGQDIDRRYANDGRKLVGAVVGQAPSSGGVLGAGHVASEERGGEGMGRVGGDAARSRMFEAFKQVIVVFWQKLRP